MRVLVNALPLRYGGGTNYLQRQMAALASIDPRTEYHTLLSPWTEVDHLPGTVETVPVRSVIGRFAYEQFRLPLRSTDLLYCPANFAPFASRAPVVLTIQNANYYRSGLELPETAPMRPAWKVRANHSAMRRADAIVAISNSLADDAKATVRGIADKLHVIHSGGPSWPDDAAPIADLPEPYVVSVASAAPHKRVDDVVVGWVRAQARTAEPVSLVLVGGHTEAQVARHRFLAGSQAPRIVHLGQISDRRRLKWIYEHALAMVSMSLLEAFPLTPAEAGSLGCPLVLSDIPPHREVTQGNGVFVPPRDTAALADVLAAAAHSWRPASQKWGWPVSWDDSARKLHTLFHSVASERKADR